MRYPHVQTLIHYIDALVVRLIQGTVVPVSLMTELVTHFSLSQLYLGTFQYVIAFQGVMAVAMTEKKRQELIRSTGPLIVFYTFSDPTHAKVCKTEC